MGACTGRRIQNFDNRRIEYSDIKGHQSYPLAQVPCVPVITDKHYFDASSNIDRELFECLGYPRLERPDFANQVVSHLHDQPDWLLCHLIEFILDNVPVNPDLATVLSKNAFVLVQDRAGNIGPKRAKPSEVIDQSSEIGDLYFDDEQIFGSGLYSTKGRYHQSLVSLGMKQKFDYDIAQNRIEKYHSRNSDRELFDKCSRLLRFLSAVQSPFEFDIGHIKLPALKGDQWFLLPPSDCRCAPFAPLVEGVLGIVPVHVEKYLSDKFRWDSILEPHVIGDRVKFIVSSLAPSDAPDALYPVFDYINRIESESGSDKFGQYIEEIILKVGSKPWLPGSIDGLWTLDRIFLNNARAFEPYMSDLSTKWTRNFPVLISQLKVAPEPSPDHLLNFISSFGNGQLLSDPQLDAVIIALKRLEIAYDSEFLNRLMIPDVSKILWNVDGYKTSEMRFAHPKVPSDLASYANIPQQEGDLASVLRVSGGVYIEDFGQQESIVTRIASTNL